MTRTRFAVMLVVVGMVLSGALSGCKQRTEVKEVPVADVGSREAEEVPAAEPTPPETEGRMADGWVVSPENEKAEGEAGYRILQEETGIELVYVPGGTFLMGSADGDPDADDDEKPQHEHPVEALWIGRTEVSVKQWRSVMGSVPEGNDQGDDHPVVEVSRDDCREFCDKAGLALPTEAQWEYSARGPTSTVYAWSDWWDPTKSCNPENRGPGGKTFPVGSLPRGASWCGAMDMTGNVWEWCVDRYDGEVYKRYAEGDLTLPPPDTGPAATAPPAGAAAPPIPTQVFRGGCWSGDWVRKTLRCAYRYGTGGPLRTDHVGFRCALPAD